MMIPKKYTIKNILGPRPKSIKFQYQNEYKCLECAGTGRIYDPNDPPCIIEGNKLRNRIQCPRCKGNKLGTKAEHYQRFKENKVATAKRQAAWDEDKKMFLSIKNKLTRDEIDFLYKKFRYG